MELPPTDGPLPNLATAQHVIQTNLTSVLAQKAIQQITEPVATPAIGQALGSSPSPIPSLLVDPNAPQPPAPAPETPGSQQPVNFVQEIQSMLYAFGDSRRPKLETAILVDDIVRQQMVEILSRAIDSSHLRGAGGVVSIEDVAFLLRKNPVKVQRFVQYFRVKDMATVSQMVSQQAQGNPSIINLDSKRAKRCRDFLVAIDTEGGMLHQALHGEIHDQVRVNRLKRLDKFSRNLNERKYAEFTRARQVSFLGQNARFCAKFKEWILTGIKATADETPSGSPDSKVKMDRSGLEGLSYLAYETVGTLVDMALCVRHDADPDNKGDPVQQVIAPVAYNAQFPMVQMPVVASDDPAARLAKDIENIWTQPLEPHHVLEAVRRLTQRPTSFMGWHRRPEGRNQVTPMPLIAL